MARTESPNSHCRAIRPFGSMIRADSAMRRHAIERQPQQEARQRNSAEPRRGAHADEPVANPPTPRDTPARFEHITQREKLPDRYRGQNRQPDEQGGEPEHPLPNRADEAGDSVECDRASAAGIDDRYGVEFRGERLGACDGGGHRVRGGRWRSMT